MAEESQEDEGVSQAKKAQAFQARGKLWRVIVLYRTGLPRCSLEETMTRHSLRGPPDPKGLKTDHEGPAQPALRRFRVRRKTRTRPSTQLDLPRGRLAALHR